MEILDGNFAFNFFSYNFIYTKFFLMHKLSRISLTLEHCLNYPITISYHVICPSRSHSHAPVPFLWYCHRSRHYGQLGKHFQFVIVKNLLLQVNVDAVTFNCRFRRVTGSAAMSIEWSLFIQLSHCTAFICLSAGIRADICRANSIDLPDIAIRRFPCC